MRIGFVTCVRLGEACLQEMLAQNAQISLLVTLKDDIARSKSGRVYLDGLAAEHGLPLVKVRHINDDDAVLAIEAADLDWLFIVGWSQIAGPQVLKAVSRGVLGMHPTLLPEGRGRASIPWTILKGLKRSGVTLFQLDEGVDTGPILRQEAFSVAEDETATSLYAKVVGAHLTLARSAWGALSQAAVAPRVQDSTQASVWPGRKPEDGRLVPSEMTLAEVDRLVRATTRPYPGAFVQATPTACLRIWGGRPLRPNEQSTGITVDVRDGVYLATDYEWN